MSKLVTKAIIVILITLGAIWAVYPPGAKLHLGKDLAGGVTLVYQVDVRPTDPPDTINRVIDVLKERVDPNNAMDISFQASGGNRIEITMPAPTARVRALRAEIETAIDALAGEAIPEEDLDRIFRLPQAERTARLQRAVSGDAQRLELLQQAAAASDTYTALQTDFDQKNADLTQINARIAPLALNVNNDDPLLTVLYQQRERLMAEVEQVGPDVAIARRAYKDARQAALSAMVSGDEIRRILRLSDQGVEKRNSVTKEVVSLPSPRREAIDRLKTSHPSLAAGLDDILAKWTEFERQRKSLDDPQDLVRLLQGAGVLNFRITVDPGTYANEATLRQELQRVGPYNVRDPQAAWYKINKIENWFEDAAELQTLKDNPAMFFAGRGYIAEAFDGQYWMLCWNNRGNRLTEADGAWGLLRASPGTDELGRPSIVFEMDALGARRLGELTENNVNKRMAVLLDDEIYTAPTLQSRISRSGQITGSFSAQELAYIVRVLSAGSLQAKLSPDPISQDSVSPELGIDNLRQALSAAVLCFIVCAGFLILYYFRCGVIAAIALALNTLLLVGIMAAQHAAFTVPAIAGVILSFAMAVDANVLVYERIREELQRGEPLKNAVRLGYQRAMSAIVDGNLTNLIVCVVLQLVGTQEIKGFGISMTIGVLVTLFTQLFVTRLLFDILVLKLGWKRALMLPMAVPAVQRALTFNVDWMRLRPIFYVASTILLVIGIGMIVIRGSEMLDSEFRGGTAVTLQFKNNPDGTPMTMTRQDAQDALLRVAAEGGPVLADLRNADVVALNAMADRITSNRFKIKTIITDVDAVNAALVKAFGDKIDSQPKLDFTDADAPQLVDAPVYPILDEELGKNIDREDILTAVTDYSGGVAIVLGNLTPPPTLDSLRSRLTQTRNSSAYSDAVGRKWDIVITDGTEQSVRGAAVLVADRSLSFLRDQDVWRKQLAESEWNLTRSALTEATTLMGIESFSPSIAATFAARAIVAALLSILLIIIYVWVRFNSFRYSFAAIIATIHDVIAAIGLIALAEILYDAVPGLASSLGILPFKLDLVMVAAILTILGYSINDKIVVMDRIRENRGKLPYADRELINRSINQTMSRTIMTGFTTILSTVILFVLGGEGVRGFAYALGLGIIIGTYSSVGVGAPMIWSRRTAPRSETAALAPQA